jgi:serine/threonine protein kinase
MFLGPVFNLSPQTLMMSIAPNKNVVRLYGLCQELNNFSLVMDYLAKGALDTYCAKLVKGGKGWDSNELYRIALGISRGMAHLAQSGIVHRDLAARNILLSEKCEPKVSDFGMSRVLNSEGASGKTNSNVGPIRCAANRRCCHLTPESSPQLFADG